MNRKNHYVFLILLFLISITALRSNAQPQDEYLFFDLTDDSYVDFGATVDLNELNELDDSQELTVTLWTQWQDRSHPDVGQWANMVTMTNNSGSGDVGQFWFQHNSGNSKFEFAVQTTSKRVYIQASSPNPPVEGQWYHLAGVYDGSEVKLYVDGVERASKSLSGNIKSIGSNSQLNFGRWPNSSNNYRRFYGSIDEVSIWKKALNQSEINNLKDDPESVLGSSYDATGLTGYWNFKDGSLEDLSPAGNDGTNGGTAYFNPLVWEGNSDDEWNNSSNWSLNIEPGDGHKVLIPSGEDVFPVINTSNEVKIYDIEIENNSSITIPANKALTVKNKILLDGDIILRTPQNSGATGSLIDNGIIQGSGKLKVERFFTRKEWHYFGIPVKNTSSSIFTRVNGGWNPNLFSYDESTQWPNGWIYAHSGKSGDDLDLSVTKGYAFYSNMYTTAVFEGAPNTGNITTGQDGIPALQYSTTNAEESKNGWNLVANPYPSALNWENIINSGGLANVDHSIYFWDGSNYTYYVAGGNDYQGTGTTASDGIIPGMQAFFVKANASNPQITFSNNAREHSTRIFYKKAPQKQPNNQIRIRVENDLHHDEAVIRFLDSATPEQDSRFDAFKIFTNVSQVPQVFSYTPESGTKLAINTLPFSNQTMSVELGFKTDKNGNYIISAAEVNFNYPVLILLEDKKTGNFIDISQTAYSFDYQTSDAENRFVLHFESLVTSSNTLQNKDIQVYANENTLTVKLDKEKHLPAMLLIYDLTGRKILSHKIQQSFSKLDLNIISGIYIVNVKTQNREINKKVLLN